jgi:hypothetical protein
MKPITLQEAKNLEHGNIIYAIDYFNADETHQRFRVNGKPKTWVRNPNKVKVPLKRGLHEFLYLTESNLEEFSLTEE